MLRKKVLCIDALIHKLKEVKCVMKQTTSVGAKTTYMDYLIRFT